MYAIEWCERCQSRAPAWSAGEYADWVVLLTPAGEYLGVVCTGCVADEELLARELEDALALAAG